MSKVKKKMLKREFIKMNYSYEKYKEYLKVLLEMLKDKTNDGLLSFVLYGSVARGLELKPDWEPGEEVEIKI